MHYMHVWFYLLYLTVSIEITYISPVPKAPPPKDKAIGKLYKQ